MGLLRPASAYPVIVRIERLFFGDSLQSIRFFAGLAGACTVFSPDGSHELSGKRFAQTLAALAVLFAGIFLAMDHYIVNERLRTAGLDGMCACPASA
jgi:hypothetical protein